MPGDVVADRYELEQLVGSGGMSSVYRAHDRVLERDVALKVLHERLNAQQDVVDRFGREAKLVAGLSHPNIVAVIDRGDHDGRPFIVLRVHRRREPQAARQPHRPAPGRAGARARDRDRPWALLRPPEGVRAPRRQAAERAPERQGRGEGDRLRDRAAARGAGGRDRDRHRARHLRLHLARAGAGAPRRRADRCLLARDRALRAAHRRGAVRRATTSSRSRCSTSTRRRPRSACSGRRCRAGSSRRSRRLSPRTRPTASRAWRRSAPSSRLASQSSGRARTPARRGCSRSPSPSASAATQAAAAARSSPRPGCARAACAVAAAALVLRSPAAPGRRGRRRRRRRRNGAIQLKAVRSYDPYREQPDREPAASSPTPPTGTRRPTGAPSTTTTGRFDKPGVGIVLDAGSSLKLRTLTVALDHSRLHGDHRGGQRRGRAVLRDSSSQLGRPDGRPSGSTACRAATT